MCVVCCHLDSSLVGFALCCLFYSQINQNKWWYNCSEFYKVSGICHFLYLCKLHHFLSSERKSPKHYLMTVFRYGNHLAGHENDIAKKGIQCRATIRHSSFSFLPLSPQVFHANHPFIIISQIFPYSKAK